MSPTRKAEMIPVPRGILLYIADLLSGEEHGNLAEKIDRLVRQADVTTLDDFLVFAANDVVKGR